MNIFLWRGNKFKLFKWTIFSFSIHASKVVYRVLGMPIWKCRSELAQLIKIIENNHHFDVRHIDKKIETLVFKNLHIAPSNKKRKNRLVFLATELYSTGGHTKCLREYLSILNENFDQALFLTKLNTTKFTNQQVLDEMSHNATICGKEINLFNWKKQIYNLYNEICYYSPKVVFVFIHPNDVFGSMLLSIIQKNTNIGILFYPHASHYPNIGMNFADLTLHNLSITANITRNKRHFYKTHVFGLISKKIEDSPSFTANQISERKKNLGIKEKDICLMAGGAAYKFFDSPNSSDFFKMLKEIMKMRANIHVVLISEFDSHQMAWIESFFSESTLRNRLTISPFHSTYELSFSCADIFIDSFPVSSALTMIDLMRLKVPTVVKINTKNPLWSFHEYQSPDYPYMYEKVKDFINGTIFLIDHPSERELIVKKNYDYYLSKYEGNVCKNRLIELINDYEHLQRYIDK